jgi:surface polysaccharide O-acyltransferase-like enzyme
MSRTIALAAGMVMLFVATVGVLLNVMPQPHKSTDYLVMGAAATLLCLVLLFVVLLNTPQKPDTKEPKN